MAKLKLPSEEALRRAFGKCVRELRQRIGIAQEQLAVDADISRSHMGKLERGEYIPKFPTLYRLVVALRVTFPEFATEFERALRSLSRNNNPAK